MGKYKTIKHKNRKWLLSYFIAQILIFTLFSGIITLTFRDVEVFLGRVKSLNGMLLLITFPLTIILEGILSSDMKAILVFWKLRDPLPGFRAFTNIAPNDSRIDMDKLCKLFPTGLPNEPRKQNQEWYKLYRMYENKPLVLDAHNSFLLTRDLAALTAVLIPISLVAHLLWGSTNYRIFCHSILNVVILIITCLSSQNYGKRFVANVLIEASL